MKVSDFLDLLKVLRARLASFGQTWDVIEIEGNESPVENVEIYDSVLDFYEILKTNQPKMFTDALNKCILGVQRCSWKALNLTTEEVAKQLKYEISKGKMKKGLMAAIVKEAPVQEKSNKQKKREERAKMLEKRFKNKNKNKNNGRFGEKRKQLRKKAY